MILTYPFEHPIQGSGGMHNIDSLLVTLPGLGLHVDHIQTGCGHVCIVAKNVELSNMNLVGAKWPLLMALTQADD